VWPGEWANYEGLAERLTLEGRDQVHGRLATWLIRSVDDENKGLSIQIWESREALEAYETGDFYRTRVAAFFERVIVGEFNVQRGEVRFLHQNGVGWRVRRSRY
jgi:heme-degrading monooxygenase HmoA